MSSKSIQIINDESFTKLLKVNSIIALETAKFFISLAKLNQKNEFVKKMNEYCLNQNFQAITGKS